MEVKKTHIGAYGIIIEDDKIVLIKKARGGYKGKLDLPGGGIDPGEDEETALRREILEETGCSCDYINEIGIVEENRAHRDYTQISFYYFVKTNGKVAEPNFTESEIETETEVQWHSFEEICNLIENYPAETNRQKFLKARDMAILDEFKKFFSIKI